MLSMIMILGLQGIVVHEQVEVVHADGRRESGWQRTTVAGGRLRREASSKPHVVILDGREQQMIWLNPARQMAFRADQALLARKDVPGPLMQGIGVGPDGAPYVPEPLFQATGTTRRIGDWKAREMSATAVAPGGNRITWWVAERPGNIPNDLYNSVARRVFSRPGSKWTSYFEQWERLDAFPVRTVIRYPEGDGQARVIRTVERIERKNVPPNVFRIPEDVREVANPVQAAEDHRHPQPR